MTDTPKPDTSVEAVERLASQFDGKDDWHSLSSAVAATLRQLRAELTEKQEKIARLESRDRDHLDEIERLRAEDLRQTRELTEAQEKQRERELALIRHAREGGFGFTVSDEGILGAFNAAQEK